jgi:hypothetical protein
MTTLVMTVRVPDTPEATMVPSTAARSAVIIGAGSPAGR